MKVCIYGAGAVGGFIGARLGTQDLELSAIARGATLAALRANGLRLQLKDRLVSARIRAEADPAVLGPQDLIVIAVKAPSMNAVAESIGPLIGPATCVMPAMNGVPWWFFDGMGGEYAGLRLRSVDPTGAIAKAIPIRHVMGCVVHLTCSVQEPGLIRHGFGNRIILGEPAGGPSSRVETLSSVFSRAGFEVNVSQRIQADVWYKLWGNMTMNPVSAITGATCDRILDDPLVNRFCLAVMAEAARIGAKIGCPINQSGEDRNAVTRQLGAFKTSMLQDVEAGRTIELDALVSVVREIGERLREPTPNIDALLGLSRLHARVRGLYPEA
ncbi:MAG: 2-dehydropantoate 2-reductase [Proteobacteria bacterium]|nr:MAG: 2-dehydropantoate 2-reductase [Pseudomonadota bacterium]